MKMTIRMTNLLLSKNNIPTKENQKRKLTRRNVRRNKTMTESKRSLGRRAENTRKKKNA
jgi:hypothetical protein